MGTSGRAGVLAAAVGLSRAAAWAPEWRAIFDKALAREVEERRFFLWLPVAAMGGVALNLSADSEPALWAPVALTLVVLGARMGVPVASGRVRSRARARRPVWRVSGDVAPHRTRGGAGPRPYPDRVAHRLRRGSGPEAGRGAHGDRGQERRRHAGRESSAPRPRHHPQDAGRGGGRLRGAQGAPAAALARLVAGRLRLRPRRLLRRRRRRRLDPWDNQDPAAPRRREPSPALRGGDRSRPQPPCGPRRPRHRRRRGRDRRRHGDRQARLFVERREGSHSRGRHLSHHHHFRRADDAGRRDSLRRRPAPPRAVADAGAELSDQEMGGPCRHGRFVPLRHRDRLARRHRARACDDADRARRGPPRPPGADHAQSRLRRRSP